MKNLQESAEGLVFAPAADKEGYIVTGLGKCKDEEILIGSHQGKPVVGIGKGAFKGGKFTAITLPDTLTRVGKGAFAKCTELDRVCVSSIEAWCRIHFEDGDANPLYYAQRLFLGEEEVTEVEIPEGVTALSAYTFYRFAALTEVSLPYSLTHIGQGAFSGCTGLREILLPEGIFNIREEAFSGCTSLLEITLPQSLVRLGDFAFEGCKKLHTAVIQGDISYWGKGVFLGCDALTRAHFHTPKALFDQVMKMRKKQIPSFTVVSHDERGVAVAMYEGRVITATDFGKTLPEIDIPFPAEEITDDAFANCLKLTSLFIPEGVWRIGKSAFRGCTALTSITLPQSITQVAANAFADTPFYQNPANWKNGVFRVGKCIVKADPGLSGTYRVEEDVVSIMEGAFAGCAGLTSISLPDGLERIGAGAFAGTALYQNPANWENDVLYLGKHLICARETAVGNSGALAIKEGTLTVADAAFQKCEGIRSVTLPDSLRFIGKDAFDHCIHLKAVTFGKSLPTMEESAFYFCKSLVAVHLPADPSYLEAFAALKCRTFKKFTAGELTDPAQAAELLKQEYDSYYRTYGYH